MATHAARRETRQGVQIFDVDLFRNKLESFMRKQATEMCQIVNTKKRKFSDRWTEEDKEEMELEEDCRDDLVFQFNKKQRPNGYHVLDEDEIDMEEVSPLALPSPVSENGVHPALKAWPHLGRHAEEATEQDNEESDSVAMRRQMSGYSEATSSSPYDDNWLSSCPPLSRASISSSSSMPQTPGGEMETDVEHCDALHATSFDNPYECLDLGSLEPHERNLLAALAPERFERAALIKRAFRQSDKLLDAFAREDRKLKEAQANFEVHDTTMEDFDMDQFLHV